MNHKLHNTILASTVVGAALLFGLLAAQPVERDQAATGHHPHPPRVAAGSALAEEIRRDVARDIEARARGFEADMARAGSAGEMLSLASAFIATTVVEATLASVLEDIGQPQPPASRTPAAGPAEPAGHERPARTRGAMAMPYFSTAQGLRRGIGD